VISPASKGRSGHNDAIDEMTILKSRTPRRDFLIGNETAGLKLDPGWYTCIFELLLRRAYPPDELWLREGVEKAPCPHKRDVVMVGRNQNTIQKFPRKDDIFGSRATLNGYFAFDTYY
jgi:hypothetical protein